MSGMHFFFSSVLSAFEERGTTDGVMIRISFSTNAITLILDLVFFIKCGKLCVCVCVVELKSRLVFDNILILKSNCLSVFSLIMGRKMEIFKDGIG